MRGHEGTRPDVGSKRVNGQMGWTKWANDSTRRCRGHKALHERTENRKKTPPTTTRFLFKGLCVGCWIYIRMHQQLRGRWLWTFVAVDTSCQQQVSERRQGYISGDGTLRGFWDRSTIEESTREWWMSLLFTWSLHDEELSFCLTLGYVGKLLADLFRVESWLF